LNDDLFASMKRILFTYVSLYTRLVTEYLVHYSVSTAYMFHTVTS